MKNQGREGRVRRGGQRRDAGCHVREVGAGDPYQPLRYPDQQGAHVARGRGAHARTQRDEPHRSHCLAGLQGE